MQSFWDGFEKRAATRQKKEIAKAIAEKLRIKGLSHKELVEAGTMPDTQWLSKVRDDRRSRELFGDRHIDMWPHVPYRNYFSNFEAARNLKKSRPELKNRWSGEISEAIAGAEGHMHAAAREAKLRAFRNMDLDYRGHAKINQRARQKLK